MCQQFENEYRAFYGSTESERKERDEQIAKSFAEMGEKIGHDKAQKLLMEILYD